MKANLLIFSLILFTMNVFSQQAKTLYDFKAKTIDGKDFDFSKLKGKKVMIVNTASKCGYTPQYKQLEELYVKYKSKNFEIIGFPANNFLWQEPGTNSEIKDFCEKNYGVTFQMME
ncbi:MAG: glutathione peroxidase, partial [Bacteroidota bacterium]